MARNPEWTNEELMQLGSLIEAGLTNPEIAKIMNKPRAGVQIKAHRIWGGNSNYMKKITKHKHLREPAMRYFLNHTFEQTRKKFKLTESELKSLFTVGYRDEKLKHLRKETRRHDPWSAKEYQKLLCYAGIKPREWIGKKTKRGGVEAVRGRIEALGLSTKNTNGLTVSQFRTAFGREPFRFIKTDAGPNRGARNASHFKIITWMDMAKWIKSGKLRAPEITRLHIETMAMFQKWITKGQRLNWNYVEGA